MKLDNAIVTGPVVGTRHDQRMGHAGAIGFQPGLLGQEVALHAARARRIEHGGVDQPGPAVIAGGLGRGQGVRDLFVPAGEQTKFAFLHLESGKRHELALGNADTGCASPPDPSLDAASLADL